MTNLVLIRHGETDWNAEGRWQGQADVPLNATGWKQAQQMARSLKSTGISAIYSSDLQRASQTAKVLADEIGVPVRLDSRFREIHQGEWQGLLLSEIQAHYAHANQDRLRDPMSFSPPGGEPVAQVRARVLTAVQEILCQHLDETVAIVSHGFALAVLITHVKGQPFNQLWDQMPGNGQWIMLEAMMMQDLSQG
jgi:alpha-ribazole phosphatase